MNKKTLSAMSTAFLLSLLLASTPVAALDLSTAKASGLVGEKMNGLLGVVDTNAPAEVNALVESINAQRQAEYQRIATKNGVSVTDVAKLTAQKVIGQTAPGQYIETPSGWQKR